MYNYNKGPHKVLFALDYDDTYTVDPELWLAFVKTALANGHQVTVATMRAPHENEDLDPRLTSLIPVHFCNGVAKKLSLARAKLYPNVWIDDRPDWIVGNE